MKTGAISSHYTRWPSQGHLLQFALKPTDGEQDTCCQRPAENLVMTQSVVNLPSLGFPSSLSPGSGSCTSFLPGTKSGPTAASQPHLSQRKGVHCVHSPISSCSQPAKGRAAQLWPLTLMLLLLEELVQGLSIALSKGEDENPLSKALQSSVDLQVLKTKFNNIISLMAWPELEILFTISSECILRMLTQYFPIDPAEKKKKETKLKADYNRWLCGFSSVAV